MALASVDMLVTVPISSYFMAVQLRNGLKTWPGWTAVHAGITKVQIIPASVWKSALRKHGVGLQMTRWTPVFGAFVFFIFFGTSKEARRNYRAAFGYLTGWKGHGEAAPRTTVSFSEARSEPTLLFLHTASTSTLQTPEHATFSGRTAKDDLKLEDPIRISEV